MKRQEVDDDRTIGSLGEKRIIAEFLKPLFNPQDRWEGVGDDCAFVPCDGERLLLLSTDRVPADLTAFRLGIVDHKDLGRYLAVLNVSDIAACGGVPKGLLLNLGLPDSLLWRDFTAFCSGVREIAEEFTCPIVGGDLSASSEISISATVVGFSLGPTVLTRRGARPGDKIFICRPLGLTCAALRYFRDLSGDATLLEADERQTLARQFTGLRPMIALGNELVRLGTCTSCMDNTDGIGQSLLELADASNVMFVVEQGGLVIPGLVTRVAMALGVEPLSVAFGPGADFSLVGTVSGDIEELQSACRIEPGLRMIGHVEKGAGVVIEDGADRRPLEITGWNYFV